MEKKNWSSILNCFNTITSFQCKAVNCCITLIFSHEDLHHDGNANICNMAIFGLIFTKCSPKWNWECNTPFWEVFAHILIGKGPQIGPRFGLGKSLIQTGQNDQRQNV